MTDTVILLLAVFLTRIVSLILVRSGGCFSRLSTFKVSIIAAIVSTGVTPLSSLSEPERWVRGHKAQWPFTVWTAVILGVCFLGTLTLVHVVVTRKRSGPQKVLAPLLAPLVGAAVLATGGSTFFALVTKANSLCLSLSLCSRTADSTSAVPF